MPSQFATLLRYLGRSARANECAAESDAGLLRHFVARRSEDTFAALLERHGPLVLAVCRRILREPADAEDAFQATFLVLARKAASIRNPDALAAWLHRVALNMARTLKSSTAHRQAHERQAALMSASLPVDEAPVPDWQPILHEEVDRLPEKYRLPVVLCYLEGMTHDAAAGQLNWPLGTVKGRLARARDLLRKRLVRRGVTLTGSGLAAALAQSTVLGKVPAALLGNTLRAAVSFAAGETLAAGATSARAVTLAKGALQTMTATKLVLLMGLLATVGGIATGAGLFLSRAPGEERPREQPQPQVALAPRPPAPARAEFGPEVKGLRAKVSLARDKFEVGELILAAYVVKNVSNVEQTLWHSGFWPNHLIIIKDADGKEPPLTEHGKECRRVFSPGGERLRKNVAVKVPAGGEDAAYEKCDLTKLYDLSRPGRYTVQYVYEEKQGGWEGRLPSNEAAFEVVAHKERKEDVAESEAVRVEGLSFVALAPKRTLTPLAGGTRDLDLGLRVTNVSDKPLALSGFDVIRPRLYAAGGKELEMNSGRNGLPRPPAPAVLAPGASWTWRPEARLEWAAGDISILLLRGPDGRGVDGSWWFTVKEGKYRLAVEYANSNARQNDVSLWVGRATTKEVEFEIVTRENREPGEKPAVRQD
jgi:RNA polymerase sigma-70 factor (ECF subfamily)